MKSWFFVILICFSAACGKGDSGSSPASTTPPTEETRNDPLENITLRPPTGDRIRTNIAYTKADQAEGLQGVRDAEFKEDEGKLFFYLEDSARTFWMPNTYFDLDIIYLNEDLVVTRIVRDLPHYTGDVSSETPRAPRVTSRHVLEMKASSEIAEDLRVGDKLDWESPLSIEETEDEIRERLP